MEERLCVLETRVYGEIDGRGTSSAKLSETLCHVDTRINSALVGRDKVYGVYKKIDHINQCLDPDFCRDVNLDESARYEIVSAEENLMMQMSERLAEIEKLKPVLDSEHIKAAPNHLEKLQKLSLLQIQQLEKCEELSEECQNLLESYNNCIMTLSKLFVKWDEDLTQFEIASEPKKVMDT